MVAASGHVSMVTGQGLELKVPSFQMVLMTWHFPTSRITPADHPCRLAQATCGPSPRKPQPHKSRTGGGLGGTNA